MILLKLNKPNVMNIDKSIQVKMGQYNINPVAKLTMPLVALRAKYDFCIHKELIRIVDLYDPI